MEDRRQSDADAPLLSLAGLDPHGLLDRTHDGAWLVSASGALIDWTRGAAVLFGMPLDQAIGDGLRFPATASEPDGDGVVGEHDGDGIAAMQAPWLPSGTRGDLAVWRPDGRRIVLGCRCEALLDGAGRPVATLVTAEDVTSRVDAAAKLRKSETRYRNIFQTTGVGIWEVDFSPVKRMIDALYARGINDLAAYFADHPEFARNAMKATRCKDVNEAGLRIFEAQSREDLLGPTDKVWPVESEPDFMASLFAARLGKPSVDIETTLLTVHNRPIHVLLSTAFPPESESRESIFVTVTDITARERTREAHRRLEAELAEASRLSSLGQLAAHIAHEVTQPVAGMLASAQAGLLWLRRAAPDLPAAVESFEKVVDEARRTSAIVHGIRAMARKEQRPSSPVDLHALIAETVALVAFETRSARVQILTDFAEDGLIVDVDRVQIQQVLNNLLVNAIQALAGGLVDRGRVRIETRRVAGEVLVSVDDNGPGVAEAIAETLFREFATSRESGLGLGLSLCASIIDRHQGRIWLDEKEANGARLTFALPLA